MKLITARSGLFTLASLIVAGGVCAFVVSATGSPGVTTYAATCLTPVTNGVCSLPGRTLGRATFTVSVQRQQVRVSEDGSERVLKACVVQSKRNWRCQSLDGGGELGITGGRPWLNRGAEGQADIFFISRWQYLWMKTGETRPGRSFQTFFR